MKPVASKVEAIANFPRTGSTFLLGLTGYYHRFLPNYASVVAPLTNLTRKYEPEIVSWPEDCSRVFSKSKEMLLSYLRIEKC